MCCSILVSQAAWLGLGRNDVWTRTARTGDYPSDRASYFRPSEVAQIGSGLGKAIRDFKKGVSDDAPEDATREAKKEISEDLPR